MTPKNYPKHLGLALCLLLVSANTIWAQKKYTLESPDKRTTLHITTGSQMTWSVTQNGVLVIPKVRIGMTVNDQKWGDDVQVTRNQRALINTSFEAIVPLKNRQVADHYNMLTLRCKGGYAVQFRAYNEGVAYRFEGLQKKTVAIVKDETIDITFNPASTGLFPLEKSTYSHYERSYIPLAIDHVGADKFCSLPVFFKDASQTHILFSEADLYDYPNLFLKGTGSHTLAAKFPKAVAATKLRKDRYELITKEHPYIAKTTGKRTYPWRCFVISQDDKTFIDQNMVLKLSRPLALDDVSWITPGRVAWDWWNANNIFDVNFKSGLNTQTYKYYIDFAAKQGLEYIILDEGWTKSTTDILNFNPDINVKELIRYGAGKGVDIILWCLWKPLDKNMAQILDTYAGWGAKGVKVDFMQRADQYMVNSYTQIAKACAERQLLVDFHGAYKPSGLRRAYPNVVSFEGVKGNEHNKWSQDITPTHNLTLPFIRMAVGPMDYTPGAMRNAHLKNHHISFERPVSLGTRAHQAAMYVVYESGLQMYCDTPSAYLKEPETADYITQIPSTWDETKALAGQVGAFVAVARRHGDTWYVGAMSNEKGRTIPLDFSFLPSGVTYQATIYKDGINANTYAEDYTIETRTVDHNTSIEASLANGGGWSAILKKQ